MDIIDISEAKVAGSNWYVSILGVPSVPDFAKSAIETYVAKVGGTDTDDWGWKYKDDVEKPVSYHVAYDKAPGVEAGYAGYALGPACAGSGERYPGLQEHHQRGDSGTGGNRPEAGPRKSRGPRRRAAGPEVPSEAGADLGEQVH